MINPLLNVRTHFSLGESTLNPKQVKDAAIKLGVKTVVIADTMTVSGLVEISRLRDDTFDPRVGVRLCVVSDDLDAVCPEEAPTEDRKAMDAHKASLQSFYVKAFARDADGMRILFALLTRSFEDDRFHGIPRLTVSDLIGAASSESLIITTGDMDNLFTYPDADSVFGRLSDACGDRLWVELVALPTPYYDTLNLKAISTSLRHGGRSSSFLSVPTMHPEKGYEVWRMNMAIHKRSKLTRPGTVRDVTFKSFAPRTEAEIMATIVPMAERMAGRFGNPVGRYFKHAINNTDHFLSQITYKWEKEKVSLPSVSTDPDAAIAAACLRGMKDRMTTPVFGEVIPRHLLHSEYLPRLKYELQVLKDLDFATYFLVVADIVKWSKMKGILVGPGRGSVGGSLVAYLMGITEVDPIRFGLLFERFINPSRRDLPDADLDFMSTRREEVVDYIENKYQKSHVAGISNYGELGAASGMKDVGRVHDLAPEKIGRASKLVPKVHGQSVSLTKAAEEVGEIAQFRDENPRLWREAVGLEGVMKSYGKHAAGVIVSGVPIVTRGVVEQRSGSRVVNWDMRVSEDMGLIKLDILGLSTLDVISRALEYIHVRRGTVIDINSVPLDDAPTLQAFSEGRTQGVFQFEGGAARRILKDMSRLKPVEFNDLIAANALNRPGPIDAGLVDKYVGARNGDIENDLPHPNMAEALKETFNVIVYQEQVMKVAVDLCGFTLVDADGLRKAMGKKSKEMMAKFKTQFIEGADKVSGMSPSASEALFDQIEVFAGYAFNKSHAAEYSLISYQCQWLKTHYPAEFFAACLSIVDDEKLSSVVRDAESSGIEIIPPDINVSRDAFVILDDKTLVIPFSRIKGLSSKAANAIMEVRKDGPIEAMTVHRFNKAGGALPSLELNAIEALTHRLQEKGIARFCHKGHIGKLDQIGAFWKVVPGQPDSLDPVRLKDQLVLMPGLVSRRLAIRDKLPVDKHTLAALKQIIDDIFAVDEEMVHVKPTVGRKAKFMAVVDAPSNSDEAAQKFASGRGFEYAQMALNEAGLSIHDGYWTGLIKRVKSGSTITPDEVRTYVPFLEREIELMKPKLVIALGTNAARWFIPDLKGSILDHAGRAIYIKKMDLTVLIGFTPGMIYHDPSKADVLSSIFSMAKMMMDS